jgi:metallo-beta-lactamase family protein
MVTLTFLGATGTVTGSKYLLDTGQHRILIDDGLFQGPRKHRRRNWDPLPVEPSSIHAVVVTHGHVDHVGVFPRLCAHGFSGRAYASRGTVDVAHVVLPDSGRLQEEDARYANRKGYSKHKPAKPLYTEKDAKRSLKQFQRCRYNEQVEVAPGVRAEFIPAGHIAGSAHVRISIKRAKGEVLRILFSGDVGQYDAPIMIDPSPLPECDVLLTESTYGNRDHPDIDPRDELAELVTTTLTRGGRVLIPAFAIGRSQEVLYLLHELQKEGRIPDVPIVLDSPMAQRATQVLLSHPEDHDEEMVERSRRGNPLAFNKVSYSRNTRRSRAHARSKQPAIVVAASGMLAGGRVLFHLKNMIGNPRNSVLLTGFQAWGTRGRRMLEGEPEIKMHGEWFPVKCQVEMIHRLSAHADRTQMLRWLGTAKTPPARTFVVHGEPRAAAAFLDRIESDLGWNAEIPEYLQSYELG